MASPITILLIEDSAPDVFLVLRFLNSRPDFAVEEVHRLSSGLARLSHGGIDVVLLDLGLPDSYGLDTLTQVLGFAPRMPVIVLTGLEDERAGAKAIELGARNYLLKGAIDSDRLIAAILKSARPAAGAQPLDERSSGGTTREGGQRPPADMSQRSRT